MNDISIQLNELIDNFVNTFNDDIKQHDKNWIKLIGTTVGGSEIAAILGLNPFSNFYKVVSNKIDICKGKKMEPPSVSCIWGTIFETIAMQVIEIDLGNKVKGSNICIQKIEGHRNSPDGYTILHLYKNNDIYHIWSSDMNKDIIEISIIVLLEIKCPISRKLTGDIPKYYKPQVLSGLAVSPIASKGLYIDFLFRKCSLTQLELNNKYDNNFHKDNIKLVPIAYGVLPIIINQYNIPNDCIEIYEKVFNIKYTLDSNNIIDLGIVSSDIFSTIMQCISNYKLSFLSSTIKFFDNRGDKNILGFATKPNYKLFAVLPWKLFDSCYIPIDRDPDFLESVYPVIQEVHKFVITALNNNLSVEDTKIMNICSQIYD